MRTDSRFLPLQTGRTMQRKPSHHGHLFSRCPSFEIRTDHVNTLAAASFCFPFLHEGNAKHTVIGWTWQSCPFGNLSETAPQLQILPLEPLVQLRPSHQTAVWCSLILQSYFLSAKWDLCGPLVTILVQQCLKGKSPTGGKTGGIRERLQNQ